MKRQLFVLFAILALSMAESPMKSIPKEIHEARMSCMTELGIEMPKSRPSGDDPKFKCLGKCIIEKVGIIPADGTYNDASVPDELKEVSKKCFEDNKDLEACERAHQFLKCTFKAIGQSMKVLSEECAKETNTEVQFDDGVRGKWKEMMQDDKMACYHRCMLMKLNKINEEDELIVGSLAMYIPDGMDVQEIADTCSKENNQEEQCLKAHKRGLCVMEQIKMQFKQ